MTFGRRNQELLAQEIVDRINRKRRAQLLRRLAWAISIASLLLAALALAHAYGVL